MDLWIVFITGLTTGGLSCLAMQGGLLASVIANQKGTETKNGPSDPVPLSNNSYPGDWPSVAMFIGAKLVSHTLFGAVLGAAGSIFTLSLGMRITFQLIAAVFILATALNLLNVHPVFRFVSLQTPRFLQRRLKNSTRTSSLFAPALVGFLTVLVPCGVTQAMEVLAISSGSAWGGALIMFTFVIGTSPLFGLVGLATAKLSGAWRKHFLRFTAALLVLIFTYSLNGALQVLDSPVSWQKLVQATSRDQTGPEVDAAANQSGLMNLDQVQRLHIDVLPNGYRPNRLRVTAGQPVELTVQTDNVSTCAASFTFRSFDIDALLKPTDSRTFRFTPDKPGKYTFSCSMGMYTGVLEVI